MRPLIRMSAIALVCFITLTLKSQTSNVQENFMEFEMNALLNSHFTKDYAVSVYLEGVKIDSIFCDSKRVVQFTFDYNQVYSLRFQKLNCSDKIVIVNTTVPKGMSLLKDDIQHFDVEMSNNLLKKTSDISDFPVAILVIDKKEKILLVCEAYHLFVHGENKLFNSFNNKSDLAAQVK